jgi:glycosyltransferase involved in cell wall biosynthesis
LAVKVIHLTTVHSWQDPRIFLKQCRSLAKAGYEVHLLSRDAPDAEREGVRLHPLKKVYTSKVGRMLFGTAAAWKQAMEMKPDIIHFHDPELIPGSFKAKKAGIKVVYDIHEDYTTSIAGRSYIPGFITGLVKALISRYETKAHREHATIIAEDYYAERFPHAIPIRNYPVMQGMDEVETKTPSAKAAAKVLYTGTLDFPRGALVMAKLHQKLKGMEVRMIGRCSAGMYAAIEEILGDEVRKVVPHGITDYVPFSEILKAYQSGEYFAGLALFPKSEHFARKRLTKFYEYMYFGLPVIASDYPEWTEFIEENKLGYTCNPENLDEAAELINKVQGEWDKLWVSRQPEMRALVEQKYSWEAEAARLVKMYQAI